MQDFYDFFLFGHSDQNGLIFFDYLPKIQVNNRKKKRIKLRFFNGTRNNKAKKKQKSLKNC